MLTNVSNGFSQSRIPENKSITKPDILFIGSGNFSLPLIFVLKRMNLLRNTHIGNSSESEAAKHFPSRVLVTELKSEQECLRDPITEQNISMLRDLGSQVMYKVDGRFLDTTFLNERFSRIQWDCPDTHDPFCDSRCQLPDAIKKTADSASSLQNEGDTLHFTLITPKNSGKIWQAVHYQIPKVEEAGYYLKEGAPRETGPDRYKHTDTQNNTAYTHKKTQGDAQVEAATLGEMSEFVFVRHPTQKTPARYLSTYRGHKQRSLGNGQHEPVDTGNYPYYSKKPGRPCSPTIQPISFFNEKIPTKKPVPRFSPSLDPLEEIDCEFDTLDVSEMDSKQERTALRNMSRSALKRTQYT